MSGVKEKLGMDSGRCNSLKKWFLKWDRTIAGIAAVLIFSSVLVFVIVNIEINHQEDAPDSQNKSFKLLISTVQSCAPVMTTLGCSSADFNQIRQEINELIETHSLVSITNLKLSNVVFDDDQIEKGWLEVDLEINQLTIQDTSLSQMKPHSFSGKAFTSLAGVTLSNTKIKTLTHAIFRGTSITDLEINNQVFRPIQFELGVFSDLPLKVLQLQNCIGYSALLNITGPKTHLPSLNVLDLRVNDLATLEAESFAGALGLEMLYLTDSKIKQIEANAFKGLSLTFLDLRYNLVDQLPPGIFDGTGGIVMSYNYWKCDCNMVWFRDYFNSHRSSFIDMTFLCNTDSGNVEYTEVDFCPNDTISTTTKSSVATTTRNTTNAASASTSSLNRTTTTPAVTQLPSTTEPSQVNWLQCADYIDHDPYHFQLTHDFLNLRNGKVFVTFALIQYDADPVYWVRIDSEEPMKAYLLWFLSKTNSMSGCVAPQNTTQISIKISLKYEQTYVFCLQNSNKMNVSPYDCAALAVPPQLEDQTWIPKKLTVPIVCAISVCFLLIIFLSTFITFCCIRQHPNLIKGNKRVIMVKSTAADAIIMPKDYYSAPSFKSCSNGYLVPNCYNRSPSVIYGHVPYEMAPASDDSPDKTCYKSKTQVLLINHHNEPVYEPPPLPPNHPLGHLDDKVPFINNCM